MISLIPFSDRTSMSSHLGGKARPCHKCGYAPTYPATIKGNNKMQIDADRWVAKGCPKCGAKS